MLALLFPRSMEETVPDGHPVIFSSADWVVLVALRIRFIFSARVLGVISGINMYPFMKNAMYSLQLYQKLAL